MFETDLESYDDPFVVAETGSAQGTYVRSYRYQGGLVEVHLFRLGDQWSAFLTKAPGFPLREAEPIADAAYRIETSRADRVRIVIDPYSLPRTGSL